MPRTKVAAFATAVLPLLAALALLAPGMAVAGPPEEPSGKMVYMDRVAEGLRRYRQEEDWEKRTEWLEKLAPTCDPRVGVVLGELVEKYRAIGVNEHADREICLYTQYYSSNPPPPGKVRLREDEIAMRAWEARRAELHRRAAQLPR
jgi:hypothetical protein